MNKILVFYAGLLYGEYNEASFTLLRVQGDLELYNGGYAHINGRWYRVSGEQLLIEDVPKELLVQVLLLS